MTDHFNTLLNTFLDGTITETDEGVLFGMMERDPVLREQFVSAVRIQQTAPMLGVFTGPAPSTTHRIMSGVAQSRPAPLSWTNGKAAVVAIGTSVLAGLIFLSGVEWGRQTPQPTPTTAARSESTGRVATNPVLNGALRTSSSDGALSPEAQASLQHRAHHSASIVHAPLQFRASRDDASHTANATPLVSRASGPPTPNASPLRAPDVRTSALTQAPFAVYGDDLRADHAPWQLQVRTIQTVGASAYRVPTNDQTGLNNLAIDALYAVTDDVHIGVEVGRQSFLQEYEQTDGGITQLTQQYPALLWVGPTVRYMLHDGIADNVSPYGQIVAGLSSGGFVGRSLLGVAWSPSPNLYVTGGVEAGNLWYTANGTPLTSTHFNWSLGMGFTW